MNEFEKKLLADLQAGNSADDIIAEFRKHLSVAEKEHKAVQEKTENRATKAKTITDLANRLLEGKPTAEDVAYVFQSYFTSKWSKSEVVTQQVMTAGEVDEMVNTAVKMFDALEPLMGMVSMSWDDVASKLKSHNSNTTSDDKIIKDFIQKIM